MLFLKLTRFMLLVAAAYVQGCNADLNNENNDVKHRPTCESPWEIGKFPSEDKVIQVAYTTICDHFSCKGNLESSGEVNFPQFQNNNTFFFEVNRKIRENSKTFLYEFITTIAQEEKQDEILDQEARDMDFDKRDFCYHLVPVYASNTFVSLFGVRNYYVGMPHGNSRYYAFNYWWNGQEVQDLSFENLFLNGKEAMYFLANYCCNTLKRDEIGYFYPDPTGNIDVEISSTDLKVFTLSEKGLTITFQPYHVGGWADGPYSATIPFQYLMHLINSDGPLSEFNIKK